MRPHDNPTFTPDSRNFAKIQIFTHPFCAKSNQQEVGTEEVVKVLNFEVGAGSVGRAPI